MNTLSNLEHDKHEEEQFNFILKQLVMLSERIEQLEKKLEELNLEDQ